MLLRGMPRGNPEKHNGDLFGEGGTGHPLAVMEKSRPMSGQFAQCCSESALERGRLVSRMKRFKWGGVGPFARVFVANTGSEIQPRQVHS